MALMMVGGGSAQKIRILLQATHDAAAYPTVFCLLALHGCLIASATTEEVQSHAY
jgi:hypothetical protein